MVKTPDQLAYQNIWQHIIRDLSSSKFLESYHYRFVASDVCKTEKQASLKISDWVLCTIANDLNKLGYQTFHHSTEHQKKVVYELKIMFPTFSVSNVHHDPRMEYIAVSTLLKKRERLTGKRQKKLLQFVKKYVKKNVNSKIVLFKFENISTEVTRFVVSHLNKSLKKISFRYLKTVHLDNICSPIKKYDYIQMERLKEGSLLFSKKNCVIVRYQETPARVF